MLAPVQPLVHELTIQLMPGGSGQYGYHAVGMGLQQVDIPVRRVERE